MRMSMGIVALGLVGALGVAPLTWAQGTSDSGSAPSTGKGAADKGAPHSPAASPAGSGATSASPSSADFTGRHTMTGEVTKVDSSSGKFSLKTGEGTLELHAPPAALAGVKQGDRMSVEIAVKPMK